MANERIHRKYHSARRPFCLTKSFGLDARIISEADQDDDGVSDAETETQARYMPDHVKQVYPQAGPSMPRQQQPPSDIRLRTRTILLELANELESTRREMDAMQTEKLRAVRNLVRSPCFRDYN